MIDSGSTISIWGVGVRKNIVVGALFRWRANNFCAGVWRCRFRVDSHLKRIPYIYRTKTRITRKKKNPRPLKLMRILSKKRCRTWATRKWWTTRWSSSMPVIIRGGFSSFSRRSPMLLWHRKCVMSCNRFLQSNNKKNCPNNRASWFHLFLTVWPMEFLVAA